MRLLRTLTQGFLRGCQVDNDDEYDWFVFEFLMNYSIEGLRNGYIKAKEEKEKEVSNEMLRKLGYTEDDIKCKQK